MLLQNGASNNKKPNKDNKRSKRVVFIRAKIGVLKPNLRKRDKAHAKKNPNRISWDSVFNCSSK